jgi:hypothetical protein
VNSIPPIIKLIQYIFIKILTVTSIGNDHDAAQLLALHLDGLCAIIIDVNELLGYWMSSSVILTLWKYMFALETSQYYPQLKIL